MQKKIRPLLVPLTQEEFRDFLCGKTWIVKKAERRWERQIFPGRSVTISFRDTRITGLTVGMVVFGPMSEIFNTIPWKEVEPRAHNKNEAAKLNVCLLGAAPRYVAFEVKLYF